jgi:hypothetical protein
VDVRTVVLVTVASRVNTLATLMIGSTVLGAGALLSAPSARAVPAPEVEYTYNVTVRRHYAFPHNDALGFGWRICDNVQNGASYRQVMSDVKHDVVPNDEASANYLVSYAVGILCPAQIWQLRNSAAHYQPG